MTIHPSFTITCRLFFLLFFGIVITLTAEDNKPRYSYQDSSKPVEKRVKDLLKRMTLEEKVAQMSCIWSGKNRILDKNGNFNKQLADKYLPNGIGFIARPSDNFGRGPAGITRGPRETAELVNTIQKFMIRKSRWGIPVLFHEEGLHGCMAKDGTHFPQAIALASTWNPKLIKEIYTVVAREIRARGVHHVLSPVVDVARDPRWGRIEETFGEDPYLVSELGVAAVKGFQGDKLPLAEGRVLATLKHMTGHGQPESGMNIAPAAVPERMLREVFLPPFERAVKEAGAAAVMASYNEIDGVPSHTNGFLLTEILRGEWGFEGIVVADYYGIKDLMSRHRVAPTLAAAAHQALEAGVDVELPDRDAYRKLINLVQAGTVQEAQIDIAVQRILRVKFLAGLFENPFADPLVAEKITGNKEARNLALKAAQQAVVLLKNENDVLPLDILQCKRIVVVGPNANETLLGGYSDVPKQVVNILDGICTKCGDRVAVGFARGVSITKSRNWFNDKVELADEEENRRLIQEAVETVQGADYAIVAVGGNEETSREGWAENHLGDRPSLKLVGQQKELVEAVVATGVPTILVLINGRPLAIAALYEKVPAILEGWYLGQETGTAVADILFGDVNPSGKLPVTIPRSVGHLPHFYNRKPTAGRGYLFESAKPFYPFGYGLSYTKFKYKNFRLNRKQIGPDESLNAKVDVVNTGTRAGDEIVQLYAQDKISSVTRPVKELKGFKRITLEPGKSTTVSIKLTPAHLAFYNRAMQRVVEPGEFVISVGPNSEELLSTILTVTNKK